MVILGTNWMRKAHSGLCLFKYVKIHRKNANCEVLMK